MPLSAKNMMNHYLNIGIHNDKVYVGITGPGVSDNSATGGKGTFVALEET